MAINIGTNAQFATANMKPESGEQIDSLWGQNIADNTGFLFFRPYEGPSFSLYISQWNTGPFFSRGTKWFLKQPGLNTLIGSYNLYGSYGVAAAKYGSFSMYVNNVSVKATAVSVNNNQANVTGSISYDISALTNGVWYPVSWSGTHTGAAATPPMFIVDWQTWQVP